jgi:ABC-type transport system involved in cytochrome c biogenesis ATPase subunit
LQVVTLPRNREIVWINLTKRIEDALGEHAESCSIPANFALWTRPGERNARPLTDALTKAAARARLSSLAPTQFHVCDLLLPAGDVRPSPAEAFQRLVKTAILKLPFVTRGEESDVAGSPPFDIEAACREAAKAPAPPSVPTPEPSMVPAPVAVAEPSLSSQENVFFDFIGCTDFGPFSTFVWDEMAKINVIVGENDTGKSHLLRLMYALARGVEDFTSRLDSDRPTWAKALAEKLVWTFEPEGGKLGQLVRRFEREPAGLTVSATLCNEEYSFSFGPEASSDPIDFGDVLSEILPQPNLHALFLPPKEVLTSLNAITLVRERRMFGFDDTYVDLARALRLEPPVQGILPDELQSLLDNLDKLLDGRIVTDQGRFFFVRGAEKFGMSQTAEGIKKIGILARLIQNGELRRNSILFLDEPEVNLHPKAARKLVRMLFDLSRAGVQIFVATHSYFVLKELEILAREQKEPVMLCSLARGASGVEADFADLQTGLPETAIGREALAQYDEDVEVSWKEEA